MAAGTHPYRPDYAVPPGAVLEEHLDARGMSQAELARRCGRSAKLVSEILAGKAPVEPKTALQFERVLGVDADIWLGIEADYRLHRARESQAQETPWVRSFPLKELVKRGWMRKSLSESETLSELLAFFGVGSVEAWRMKYDAMAVAYRHSPSFKSDTTALATWLRLGELEAERQECADYSAARFKRALTEIRPLTRTPVTEALEEARKLCNEAGVVLALIEPLPGTALSGAAWWLTPRKAVVALTARHKRDDHLWFSLFHEAAHVLLHSRKTVFVETEAKGEDSRIELEADRWTRDFLVPCAQWERFLATDIHNPDSVRRFAEEQGIAPGIIVGRLQYEGHLLWGTPLNRLKVRLEWTEDPRE